MRNSSMTTTWSRHVPEYPRPGYGAVSDMPDRPFVFDSPAVRFRMQSEEAQATQSMRMAQHKVVAVYRELSSWFAGTDEPLFGLSYWEANGQDWGWGCAFGESRRTFRKWVPTSDSDLQELADAVSAGAYDINTMGRRKMEQGYHGEVLSETATDILRIYDAAAWGYDGKPFPEPPRWFAGWKTYLRWFTRCRDALGVAPMLDAYAYGVPLDYIVPFDVTALRNEWEKDHISHDGSILDMPTFQRFPHMSC